MDEERFICNLSDPNPETGRDNDKEIDFLKQFNLKFNKSYKDANQPFENRIGKK